MVNNVKTVGLLALLGAVFVAVGFALGGRSGATVALVIAAVMNFGMYFFSDKLALRSARAKEVSEQELPEVYAMVRSLAQREQIPMPRIYYIDSPQPNAFATGRNPEHAAVAVTGGILQLMSREELEGVLAHELAHVKNRDILIGTIAATIGAALTFLSRMALFGGLGGGDRRRGSDPVSAIIGIVGIIVAPLAAMIIQMAISRAREYQADRSGAEITGQPLALANALRKLEAGTSQIPMQVNASTAQLFIADPLKAFGRRGGGGGLGRMFSTHPPIPERVNRLEQMAMGIR